MLARSRGALGQVREYLDDLREALLQSGAPVSLLLRAAWRFGGDVLATEGCEAAAGEALFPVDAWPLFEEFLASMCLSSEVLEDVLNSLAE